MSTTFYDRRAERQVASAVAEQHRADAAARLADVELRKVEVESARADLTEKQRAAEDAREASRRETAKAERAARWATFRQAVTGLRTRIAAVVPALVGGIAMGAPILIGWNGQLQTARMVLHLGSLAWVYPVALEGGAWWLAYLMHRAIAGNHPVGRLRVWMWLLAGLAAGMNFWHGMTAYGPIGGAGLALSSLLGIGLWELTAGHQRHSTTGATADHARTALARWVRFPLLSIAAASAAAARGKANGGEGAWRSAWIDRYGVGPDATRRDRRLGRLIISTQWRTDREAAKRGDLMIVSGVILRARLAPVMPTTTAAVSDQPETPDTPIEMRKLSPRGAALLAQVREAIDAKTLPETPSARAIRSRFGGGMATAIEVREHLAKLHTVDSEGAA